MHLLYDDADSNNITDTINLLIYINDLTKRLGIPDVMIDDAKCFGIIAGMKQDFPHSDGLEAASPFKKVANFVAYFIAESPIYISFPKDIIGDDLARINNHQNAIIALLLAIDSLHGAVINRRDGEICALENKILISNHSFIDIVDAISRATQATHFKMLSVLLEQLAYKTNPECQYSDFVQ